MSKYISGYFIRPGILMPYQDIPNETRKILKNLKYAIGLYFLYGDDRQLLYIGKSTNLGARIKGSAFQQKAKYFKYLETNNEADAHILEPYFIMKFNPPQNGEFNIKDRPTIRIKYKFVEPEMDHLEIYDFSIEPIEISEKEYDELSKKQETDYEYWQRNQPLLKEISGRLWGNQPPEAESAADMPSRSGADG